MSFPVYKLGGELAGTEWVSVSKWRAIVLSIAYFSWVLFLSLSFSLLLITIIIIIIFYFVSIIKLFSSTRFTFFTGSPLHQGAGGEQSAS